MGSARSCSRKSLLKPDSRSLRPAGTKPISVTTVGASSSGGEDADVIIAATEFVRCEPRFHVSRKGLAVRIELFGPT
jgi:hypothetical protein